jgi:tRNA A37 threonylcarbamoyladenosine dehydratase
MVKAGGSLTLAAAFGAGVAAAIGAQLALQALRTVAEAPSVAADGGSSGAKGSAAKEQELADEQLSRIKSFFGEDGLAAIRGAFVVVVGVGGVGSHAAHLLARSGVGKLRLIDFDNVTLSSLNRHAVATRADVGTPKVTAMKRHLQQTVPGCEIEDLPVMFAADCADELLDGALP